MNSEKIVDIIDQALAMAGLKVMDGGDDFLIVRDRDSGFDYEISVQEIG